MLNHVIMIPPEASKNWNLKNIIFKNIEQFKKTVVYSNLKLI